MKNPEEFGYCLEDIEAFIIDGISPTVKGCCDVECDGVCEHGSQAVTLAVGVI